ncbi:hypothetical protein ABIB25_002172 [Nakamurella sp. UYEF19]|uniref:hypothetical protein n=1 Tax=Nakamurella sp. UYEF19 TaxID=1756392 RepID=UPI00339B3472
MDLDPKLESSLRASLAARSAEVTPESLTEPNLRPVSRRSIRPFLFAAASVVLVVLIAVGGRWALAPSSIRSATPPPVPGASYVGSKFRLTAVENGGKKWSIPVFLSVTVEFTGSREIVTNDSVNVHSGTFSPTADGFVTHDVVGTLVDSSGGDSAQGAAVKAIGALALGPADGSGGFGPATVQAQTAGDLLVLKASGYTLSLVRTGPARAGISTGSTVETTASSVDQCSLPLAQRTGGWTCYGTPGNVAPTTYGPVTAWIGPVWHLVLVVHDGKSQTIPASFGATIRFTADHDVLIDDGVNQAYGGFLSAPHGFTWDPRAPRGQSQAASNSSSDVLLASTTAFQAVLIPPAPADPPKAEGLVQMSGNAGRLVVTVTGFELTFAR